MDMEFKNCTGTVRAEITTPDGITFSIEMPLVVSGKLEFVHGEPFRVGGAWGYVQGSELEEVVLTLVGRKAPDGVYVKVKTETAAPPPSAGEGGAPRPDWRLGFCRQGGAPHRTGTVCACYHDDRGEYRRRETAGGASSE